MKVYIAPDYSDKDKAADNGGIRRVAEAMMKYLPKFGVEIVHDPDDADVICNHGAMLVERPGVPSVNVNHGLYWSRQPWGSGYQEVNELVVESMRHAVAHTAPSNWVSNAIRRGGFFYPEVVYHGVDPDEFSPMQNEGYVLWNKARADYVSDPNDMLKVSTYLPERKFSTTIGNPAHNVKIIGNVSHESMKEFVAKAGVYLATARETFGIGTLEAMASGVPVAGWDWGGQSEIIVQGYTGYLAPPGDFQALADCIEKCFVERERLSENCMKDVRERWTWEPRIKQYADIFRRVHKKYNLNGRKPKVSVIVTAYKLDRYLPKCLESIRDQTFKDFECLVVDDAPLETTAIIVKDFAKKDKRFRYVPVVNNLGLPGARNFGFSQARGMYIRHVDADDYLAGNTLALETKALDNDWGVHIVYGHLETTREDGTRILENGEPVRNGWPPDQFNWMHQMSHLNQLPSCSMVRREVFERTGGYRDRMKRAEDAEFWCRATSGGFRAYKFTQAVTYFHRQRGDSKGAIEWHEQGKEPDWTSWFPWRTGAGDYEQALNIIRKYGGEHPSPNFVPFGAQGKPPRSMRYWYVHDYAYPVVSIIVTCGPGHKQYLVDALDSIQAQTYPDWECIVVNDTGQEWDKNIPGAPWAKVVNMQKNSGAAVARNAGCDLAKGRFIIWMDADDYWLPWYLEKMVSAAEQNDGVIFSDMILRTDEKSFKLYHFNDFDCSKVALSMQYAGSSVLYPRKVIQGVRNLQNGWDEAIPGMEDWDFQVAVHSIGFCAYRVPEPLFVYRMYSSTKRKKDYNNGDAIKDYMDNKWRQYRTGAKTMACGCSKRTLVAKPPSSTLQSSGSFANAVQPMTVDGSQMVNVEYVGPVTEPFTINSRVQPGIRYRFANNDYHRVKTVLIQDAEYLINLLDGNAVPLYRVVPTGAAAETNDPVAFIGQAIQA